MNKAIARFHQVLALPSMLPATSFKNNNFLYIDRKNYDLLSYNGCLP